MSSLTPNLPDRNSSWLVILATVLCLLPFCTKAVHIDDPLFIWTAQHICREPLNPYNFSLNWYGSLEPMHAVTKNPPLAAYYLALFGSVFGWSEVVLHLAMLVPAVLLALGTLRLAAQFAVSPLPAALLTLTAPVVLVSATTLMCDILMLSLWVWAVVCWLAGIRGDNRRLLFAAAVLIGLSALTKYFGAALIPLLLLWTVAKQGRIRAQLLFFLIPVAMLAGYHGVTTLLYGRGLLLDAAGYLSSYEQYHQRSLAAKALIGCAFAGGCFGSAAFFVHRFRSRTTVVLTGLLCVIFAGVLLALGSLGNVALVRDGAVRWGYLLQVALFATIGIQTVFLAGRSLLRDRDADTLLLGTWIAGTFVFACFLNWSTNARSFLPLAPAWAILLVREWERREGSRPPPGRLVRWLPYAGAVGLSLIVAAGDYSLANTVRNDAVTLAARYRDRAPAIHFLGHWGFQYYLESAGGVALDTVHSLVKKDDIIVSPFNNTNLIQLPEAETRLVDLVASPTLPFIATMNNGAAAGFYSDVFGPLPFVFGGGHPQRYAIHAARVATY
jgi:4-amino-4-deoxy-L-arabinose transferase-like glycosyltransferase